MMCDFVSLTPGDVIIQNGANSAVGQAAIQIAREMGVKTLNVVRDRKDLDAVTEFLKELGADEVVTGEQVTVGWFSLG
jgi:trans-2-enoyl-CoA reductase